MLLGVLCFLLFFLFLFCVFLVWRFVCRLLFLCVFLGGFFLLSFFFFGGGGCLVWGFWSGAEGIIILPKIIY